MKNNIITKISLEDFEKLGIKGLKLVREYHLKDRVCYEEDLERERNQHLLPDGRQDLNFIRDQMQGSWHKFVWKEVDILKEVIENMAETEKGNYVVVCIAKEPTEDAIQDRMGFYNYQGVKNSREEAIELARNDFCYRDRFQTATYDIYMDIDKLYSIRNYYEYRTNDFFRIPKSITKVIYMISKD